MAPACQSVMPLSTSSPDELWVGRLLFSLGKTSSIRAVMLKFPLFTVHEVAMPLNQSSSAWLPAGTDSNTAVTDAGASAAYSTIRPVDELAVLSGLPSTRS